MKEKVVTESVNFSMNPGIARMIQRGKAIVLTKTMKEIFSNMRRAQVPRRFGLQHSNITLVHTEFAGTEITTTREVAAWTKPY